MKKLLFFIASLVLVLGFQTSALAAGPLGKAIDNLKPIQTATGLADDLPTSIGNIVKVLLATVGTIFLLLTIYAGILWMTAQGNSEKIDKAKQIVTAAVIGMIIVVGAYAITAFVTGKVGSIGDTNSGNNICSGSCMADPANCTGNAGGTVVPNTNCSNGTICCVTN